MDNNTDVLLLEDPAALPEDPRADLDPKTLIPTAVWAELQGVLPGSVTRLRTRSEKNRRAENSRPGDMPAADVMIGERPYWMISTYFAWADNRPGKGAGAGRPVEDRESYPRAIFLPAPCPHCKTVIKREDLPPRVRRRKAQRKPATTTATKSGPAAAVPAPKFSGP